MDDKVIVMLKRNENDKGIDVELPTNITAGELIYGLNQGLSLGLNMNNPDDCCIRMENPVAFLRGDTTLEEFGIRNGSTIYLE
ncbi:MAG: EsaB/YukD family protein [Butyrivibrio sp.]|nr:EsaB/YukD family protein [Butyrivibrio sp.]